ncbi:MAG: cysteine desulfurase [Acidobacteriaceae bacterium]|nr:cysteine desulfurase [Acidobacteriaceae bacterium]
MRRIYLDANATTPLLAEVLEEMRPFLVGQFGNASSIHQEGQLARSAVEQARGRVALLLGCRPSEVVFTSGGTESDNLAVFGSVKSGDHVISSSVEHHAVLHAVERLADRGVEVTVVPVDGEGVVSAEDVRRALRPNTRLVSVMMANNETGVLQPVELIGRITREAGVRFHVDAVQAAGKVAIDVEAIGCDLLSISGHKMHGPQGTGALFVRRRTRLEPLFAGGAHERQRRAGTENVAGIVGLGKAAECAREGLRGGTMERVRELRDRLETGLQESASGVNGGQTARVPNTANVWFASLDGEALVIGLDLKGLAVSSGAACSSGASEPSHVLRAMGLPIERARASLRFSLHRQTTVEEIDRAIDLVATQVVRLRELSAVPQ